jgi:hypothetical protein
VWPETECEVDAEPADLAGGLGTTLAIAKDVSAAVRRCAGLLDRHPGSVVIAVFPSQRSAGAEDGAAARTPHGQDPAAAEEEDLLALFLLDASPVWMRIGATDAPSSKVPARLRGCLGEALGRHAPDSVLFPLGAGDAADRLVADSCLALCADAPERRWIAYADAADAAIDARVAALQARGFALQMLDAPQADARKAHALACFTGARSDSGQARERERYWQVSRVG